jgi:hypothetical protein
VVTNPGVRKQVYELLSQDFIDHPIWEFCSDEEGAEGQDEATVRPTEKTELSEGLAGAFVVAADVAFADESIGVGYLYACDENDIACLQPNLFAGQSQVNLYLGWLRFVPDAPNRVAENYKKIGKDKEGVFPLSFRSRVNVMGAPLRVVLEGFEAMDVDMNGVILS